MEKNNKEEKIKNIASLEKKQDEQPKKSKEAKNYKWKDLNYFNISFDNCILFCSKFYF